MSVRFWWCHTEGCPDYGRARQMVTSCDVDCQYCGEERKMASPEETPEIPANIIVGEE